MPCEEELDHSSSDLARSYTKAASVSKLDLKIPQPTFVAAQFKLQISWQEIDQTQFVQKLPPKRDLNLNNKMSKARKPGAMSSGQPVKLQS